MKKISISIKSYDSALSSPRGFQEQAKNIIPLIIMKIYLAAHETKHVLLFKVHVQQSSGA